MRQVLVEAARRRTADKRGGGRAMVTLDESLDGGGVDTLDVVILDEALSRLATLSPRQAMLVEQRFFGGLEMDDVARSLGISEATAYREWRAARAWLGRELGQDRQGKP
jgi:RNA polymerase sigma factor (TIGR02999 family)